MNDEPIGGDNHAIGSFDRRDAKKIAKKLIVGERLQVQLSCEKVQLHPEVVRDGHGGMSAHAVQGEPVKGTKSLIQARCVRVKRDGCRFSDFWKKPISLVRADDDHFCHNIPIGVSARENPPHWPLKRICDRRRSHMSLNGGRKVFCHKHPSRELR